jgi:hypothetical protein
VEKLSTKVKKKGEEKLHTFKHQQGKIKYNERR